MSSDLEKQLTSYLSILEKFKNLPQGKFLNDALNEILISVKKLKKASFQDDVYNFKDIETKLKKFEDYVIKQYEATTTYKEFYKILSDKNQELFHSLNHLKIDWSLEI